MFASWYCRVSLSALACLAVMVSTAPGIEITNFTGGDPGEGLDLEGQFAYAVNISGGGGSVVNGVEFTDDLDTDGFFIESTHNLPTWASPYYGESPNDDELAFVMQSIRWSNVPDDPPTVNIEMDVTPGQAYKMQMLFTESCCDRGFDIFLEDELLVDDFVIYEHHVDDIWNIPSREDGVLITHEFTATDNLLELALGTGAPDFPDNNGHISAVTLELISLTLGDFDGNGQLDAADIDLLSGQVRAGSNDAAFDLNGDGAINANDRAAWVEQHKKTWFGDANLDGEFSSSDFVQVFQRGEYEDGVDGNSSWEDGDWNGDGDFTSGDFVTAFQGGGFEQGPRAAVAHAVPEPHTGLLLALGVLTAALAGRRHS